MLMKKYANAWAICSAPAVRLVICFDGWFRIFIPFPLPSVFKLKLKGFGELKWIQQRSAYALRESKKVLGPIDRYELSAAT